MSAPMEGADAARPIRKAAGVVGLGIVACAACCAPLVAVPILGLIASGGAGLILAGQIGLGVIVLAAIAAFVVVQRRRSSASTAASAGCGCAAESGCHSGTAFKLPQSEPGPLDGGPNSTGTL